MEQEFEDYWKSNRSQLVACAPRLLADERRNFNKMNSAGDWILFIVPIVLMIGFMDYVFFANEMLNFIVGLVLGIAAIGLSIYVKPYVTGKRSLVDIDEDIKQHYYRIYKERGLGALRDI